MDRERLDWERELRRAISGMARTRNRHAISFLTLPSKPAIKYCVRHNDIIDRSSS
jgi:hypothetical protein